MFLAWHPKQLAQGVCVCGNPVSKGVHVSSYVHIPAGDREGRAAIPANEDSPLYP